MILTPKSLTIRPIFPYNLLLAVWLLADGRCPGIGSKTTKERPSLGHHGFCTQPPMGWVASLSLPFHWRRWIDSGGWKPVYVQSSSIHRYQESCHSAPMLLTQPCESITLRRTAISDNPESLMRSPFPIAHKGRPFATHSTSINPLPISKTHYSRSNSVSHFIDLPAGSSVFRLISWLLHL